MTLQCALPPSPTMTRTQTIRMLARYNAWANRLIFDAVAALPAGEAEKPRPTLFRNMVHTLNHNYVIDRIFQAHLEGRAHPYTARNTQDPPPLAELWRAQQEVDRWYLDWAGAVSEPGPTYTRSARRSRRCRSSRR